MDYIALISTIASFCGLIYMAYTVKRYGSTEFFIEKIDEILDEVHKNRELQAKMYDVGAFMGNAIAQGTGLKTAKKSGMMGIVGDLMGLFNVIKKPATEAIEGAASFG